MTCIFENFNNMQLAPAMADCMDLYIEGQQLILQKLTIFIDSCYSL